MIDQLREGIGEIDPIICSLSYCPYPNPSPDLENCNLRGRLASIKAKLCWFHFGHLRLVPNYRKITDDPVSKALMPRGNASAEPDLREFHLPFDSV